MKLQKESTEYQVKNIVSAKDTQESQENFLNRLERIIHTMEQNQK